MKTSTIYVCQSCGYQSSKWLGRCPECEKWNSLVEETDSPVLALSGEISLLNAVDADEAIRITTGIDEFDRILGGGIVPGSVTLIGGDPGIGKSTLLLQVCDRLSVSGKKVLYVSGEESAKQAKLRANRLGTASKELYILNQTNVELIKEHIDKLKPDILVVDSVQVVYSSQITSAPGSVSQVRHCAGFLNVVA